MANNYEQATILPFFPREIALKYKEKLEEQNLTVTDEVMSSKEDSYIYAEDGCNDWDIVHEILQTMLREAKMPYCYVEGCFYCDKMRPEEFGGFAHFITPDDVQFMVTGGWIERQVGLLKKNKDNPPIEEALELVYNLAEQCHIPADSSLVQGDDRLEEESKRQRIALDTVHDFIVNNFF